MASLALGVKFLPASGGTGDFVYSTAVGGYRGSSALVDGKTYRYRAENSALTEWEYGTGVWSSSTGTLTRATVSFSSTGSKISFTSAPMVGIIQFVEDVLQFNDAMSLTSDQKAQARSNIGAQADLGYTPPSQTWVNANFVADMRAVEADGFDVSNGQAWNHNTWGAFAYGFQSWNGGFHVWCRYIQSYKNGNWYTIAWA